MEVPVIQEHNCAKAEDFLRRLSPEDEQWRSKGGQSDWIFRGQRRDLPLVPSAMRDDAFKYYGIGAGVTLQNPETLTEQLRHEGDAMNAFIGQCMSLGLPIPEDGQLVRSGFMSKLAPEHWAQVQEGMDFPHPLHRSLYALAQHNGVPTRLLDWSRCPWTAAHFACYEVARATKAQEDWDQDRVMARAHNMNPSPDPRPSYVGTDVMVVWALRRLVFRDFGRFADELGFEVIEVTAPYDANPYLRAQKGIFTLIRNKVAPKEPRQQSLERAIETIAEKAYGATPYAVRGKPLLVKLTLPHSEARRLLRNLWDYGISYGPCTPGSAVLCAQ